MSAIVPLRKMREGSRMTNVQVRLPPSIRAKAQKLAKSQSGSESKITEADVYRTAICLFLNDDSTDSRENQPAQVAQ
jgi:hypothetical protein